MKRIYDQLLSEHFSDNRQMAFVAGPRQTGKTTLAKLLSHKYLTWDNQEDRTAIIKGADVVADYLDLNSLYAGSTVTAFDELHKYSKWKTFIKGFFDIYNDQTKSLVTGSARLNIFKRGGDSLMGRYFLYRIHPLSVAELLSPDLNITEVRKPSLIDNKEWDTLLTFGGFPEPFLKRNKRFYNRWRRMRTEQFFTEDIRDLTNVQEVAQIQLLAELLQAQTGQLMNYSKLATSVNVSQDTVKRWITILNNLYYSFTIKPWHKNIKKSLIKQPKIFLWDWTMCNDIGARNENLIASHLLKAVHFWTDYGFGDYDLFFIRDKMKREVNFLVTKDNEPWFILEVKTSDNQLSPNLAFFQEQTKAEHAFQVSIDAPYIDKDCFAYNVPVKVPAKTFLSQLV
jgi:predicted AAA+ superfamily ATPase